MANAMRRRQRFHAPFLMFSTESELGRFPWDESDDMETQVRITCPLFSTVFRTSCAKPICLEYKTNPTNERRTTATNPAHGSRRQASEGQVQLLALVLAWHHPGFPRLGMARLLCPRQPNRLGQRLLLGATASRPVGQTDHPLFHRRVVRSLSRYETHRLGGPAGRVGGRGGIRRGDDGPG